MAASAAKERPKNQTPLTVEQRKERIAELYRLQMKMEDWYIAANGKDIASQEKSKVLNGVILFVKNRVNYLATSMSPVIESPLEKRKEEMAKLQSSSPPDQKGVPVGTETKK